MIDSRKMNIAMPGVLTGHAIVPVVPCFPVAPDQQIYYGHGGSRARLISYEVTMGLIM